MTHRLWSALLLRGVWKLQPIHAVALWGVLFYNGWMGSPYFMYNVVGEPEPGTFPRYVGTLRVEGEKRYSKNGMVPPRYYVKTDQGEVEFHCGFRPYPSSCFLYRHEYTALKSDEKVEVGYHWYWGRDHFKFPPSAAWRNPHYSDADGVRYGRILDLRHHEKPAIVFHLASALYLALIIISWLRQRRQLDPPQPNPNPPPKPEAARPNKT